MKPGPTRKILLIREVGDKTIDRHMKNRTEAMLANYELLQHFFLKHEQLLKTKRGFPVRYNRFCIKKSMLSVTAAHWEIVSGLSSRLHFKLRKTLCELAGSIVAIITQTGKAGHYLKSCFSPHGFEKMGDEQLVGHCRDIYSLLLQHPDDFIKHGIVLQVRNTFSGAIDLFAVKIGYSVTKVNLVKHFEQLLQKLGTELEAMLKSDMDLFIARFRYKKPLLVNEYQELRKKRTIK